MSSALFEALFTAVFCSYLAVGLDKGPAPAGVDLVATVRAQVDPGTRRERVVSTGIEGIRAIFGDLFSKICQLTS